MYLWKRKNYCFSFNEWKRSKGDLAAYSSSKFALMGLCQTMKNKGWDKNIRISQFAQAGLIQKWPKISLP